MQVYNCLESQQRPNTWKSSANDDPERDFSEWVFWKLLWKKSGPQWSVEPTVSGPPPNSLGQPTFPLLSMMSISPLEGHWPYSLQRGRSQIAGQSQSPLGSLALTSTRPQVKWKELMVVTLALMTGLMQLLPLEVLSQPQNWLPVHWSTALPPQMLQLQPFLTQLAPILSSVRMGLMLRNPSLTKLVDLLFSYIQNSQLPPPLKVRSCFHLVKSKLVKLSSKMSLLETRVSTKASSTIVEGFLIIQQIMDEPLLPRTYIKLHQIQVGQFILKFNTVTTNLVSLTFVEAV